VSLAPYTCVISAKLAAPVYHQWDLDLFTPEGITENNRIPPQDALSRPLSLIRPLGIAYSRSKLVSLFLIARIRNEIKEYSLREE
jgi:hypothetical protein